MKQELFDKAVEAFRAGLSGEFPLPEMSLIVGPPLGIRFTSAWSYSVNGHVTVSIEAGCVATQDADGGATFSAPYPLIRATFLFGIKADGLLRAIKHNGAGSYTVQIDGLPDQTFQI